MLYKGNQKLIGQTHTIQEIKKAIYPVGSVIISFVERDFTIEMPDTTWELEEEGRLVEATRDTTKVNTFVEAGLPNITGQITGTRFRALNDLNDTGAFDGQVSIIQAIGCSGSTNRAISSFKFNASKSNAIYGKSNTVQPNTRKYFIYRRIA